MIIGVYLVFKKDMILYRLYMFATTMRNDFQSFSHTIEILVDLF